MRGVLRGILTFALSLATTLRTTLTDGVDEGVVIEGITGVASSTSPLGARTIREPTGGVETVGSATEGTTTASFAFAVASRPTSSLPRFSESITVGARIAPGVVRSAPGVVT